jgi:hypothetical protein
MSSHSLPHVLMLCYVAVVFRELAMVSATAPVFAVLSSFFICKCWTAAYQSSITPLHWLVGDGLNCCLCSCVQQNYSIMISHYLD